MNSLYLRFSVSSQFAFPSVDFCVQCEFTNWLCKLALNGSTLPTFPCFFLFWEVPSCFNVSLGSLIMQACIEWETWIHPMLCTSWYIQLCHSCLTMNQCCNWSVISLAVAFYGTFFEIDSCLCLCYCTQRPFSVIFSASSLFFNYRSQSMSSSCLLFPLTNSIICRLKLLRNQDLDHSRNLCIEDTRLDLIEVDEVGCILYSVWSL